MTVVVIVAIVVVVLAAVVLIGRRRSPDTVEGFRRQIDALGPEARRPVVERVRRIDETPPHGVDEPDDADSGDGDTDDGGAEGGDDGGSGDGGSDGGAD